LISDSLFI